MKRFHSMVLLFLLFSTYSWAQSPKPAAITELEQFEKDSIEWEKLVKEITRK